VSFEAWWSANKSATRAWRALLSNGAQHAQFDEEARQDREYPIFERAEVIWVGCRRTAGMSGMSLKTLGVSDVDNMDEATVCVT